MDIGKKEKDKINNGRDLFQKRLDDAPMIKITREITMVKNNNRLKKSKKGQVLQYHFSSSLSIFLIALLTVV